MQQVVYLLHRISKEYNLEIATKKKTNVFGFVGTDRLRTKIIINDETLEQVSQFTYLGCSKSYQFSNDVEFKLAEFLQLIGNIKRTIGFSGLEVTCWPLVPKFAGSNPAEAVGFLRAKKSSARLPSEGK